MITSHKAGTALSKSGWVQTLSQQNEAQQKTREQYKAVQWKGRVGLKEAFPTWDTISLLHKRSIHQPNQRDTAAQEESTYMYAHTLTHRDIHRRVCVCAGAHLCTHTHDSIIQIGQKNEHKEDKCVEGQFTF